ncbi:MAG: carboxymuconolactone decarboxylase family protein [Deltaproteobacteria bacterium]|nr:carboxymuconolactone decarboxylase family protein [Deltaproteobacteria bacterium]MBW2447265.1 carboxymuconolactone decarboxylase family protein [Deltaproteobacteria bacterium]
MSSERILPLEPPYPTEAAVWLKRAMPGRAPVDPLRLFRIFVKNQGLADAMQPLGGHLLGSPTIQGRDRELLILRTCARCNAEYEWGVHSVGFARWEGLSEAAIQATALGEASDTAFTARDALLVRLADALHDGATVPDDLFAEISSEWSEAEILELLMVCGFYHFVSFAVNTTRVAPEPWAPGFPEA